MIRQEKTAETEKLWEAVAQTYTYQEAIMCLYFRVDHIHNDTSDNEEFDPILKLDSPFRTQALFVAESAKRLENEIESLLNAVKDFIRTRAWVFVTKVYGIQEGDVLEYTDRLGKRQRGTITSFHISSTQYGELGFRGANIRADGSVGKKEVWFGLDREDVVNLGKIIDPTTKHEPKVAAAARSGQ